MKFGLPSGASPGAAQKYLPINVKCKIEGNSEPIEINHSVCVIVVQPQVIAVQGLANDKNKMSLKIGEKYQFNIEDIDAFKKGIEYINPGLSDAMQICVSLLAIVLLIIMLQQGH